MATQLAAQTTSKLFRLKNVLVKNDTVRIDSVSINPTNFKVFTADSVEVSSENYQVDFKKSLLVIAKEKYPKIRIEYYRYPEFITKIYAPFDKRLIVESTKNTGKLYSETTNKKNEDIKLFDGLTTQGFIARGVTGGNNQNAVTNATLDLTIEGKLSDKVGIRANIFDTNFPLQQNGYSQNITDFDRIFVELFHKDWKLKGGDVSLQNTDSYFLNFEKQVSGISAEAKLNKKLSAQASGAIVRGKFTAFNFVGVEGNQGPYKMAGGNNELAIIMVEGSDRVYVNGELVERGETKAYTIDYNLAEIRFNTTYPITNDMRIRVEFQYSDRNYTRFITYEKANYATEDFSISGYFYNENDAKNQPIQQSLTDAQKQILAAAGNDKSKMVAPSGYADEFSSSRIQYKKIMVGTEQVFEYTTNENDEVYTVAFSNVGTNNGDYVVDKTIAIGTIYKYAGKNAGSFHPVVRLVAPDKLMVAVVKTGYSPSAKTNITAELALSNRDANLFSEIDDENNQNIATKVGWEQQLMDKKWLISSKVNYKFIQENFQTVQRFQAVEFARDWNLTSTNGNQHELGATLKVSNKKNSTFSYDFQHLSFSDNFSGSKHHISAKTQLKNTQFWLQSSWLNNQSEIRKDQFFRGKSKLIHQFKKSWLGGLLTMESNARRERATGNLEQLSHRFQELEGFYGIGDTTKVFAKFGIAYRANDSVRGTEFTQINNRKTFYINSKLIQNATTNLAVFANYRITNNHFDVKQTALNSRVHYNQRFFKDFVSLGVNYETSSGNIARQDFVYIKTEPGQGFYTWIDYNNDGEQQFNEFEIAQFQDQATYLRVALPNIRFVPTQRVKWKQSLTLNLNQWKQKQGFRRFLGHFYNQTYVTIDNERLRDSKAFHWNPFQTDEATLLGVNFNFRNNLYFNRGLQDNSWIYSFGKTKNKQQFSIGNQENNSWIHQLEFQHKLTKFWLIEAVGALSENQLATQNLINRNYQIKAKELHPKLSYLYANDHKLSLYYQLKNKENTQQDFETLNQHKFGLSYFYSSPKKNQLSAETTLFVNNYEGNPNSPVGYQMLEGLQVGKNFTWNLVWNHKLTSILNLSLNYFGRKSENSTAIHTGTVQLKAIF